jgi:hypothetical protein
MKALRINRQQTIISLWPNRDPIDELGFKAVHVLNAPTGPLLAVSAALESENPFEFDRNDPENEIDPKGLFAPGAGCPMPPNRYQKAVLACNGQQLSDCAAICAANGGSMVRCSFIQLIAPVPGKGYYKKVGTPWVFCLCAEP